MKTKTLGWIVTLGITLVGAMAACSQPKTECQVALASNNAYTAKYQLTNTPSAECMAYVKPGDLIGVEFYHPANADGTSYDPSITTLAIAADSLGTEWQSRDDDPDTTHHFYSTGKFASSTPDANDICSATFDVPAQQNFPAVAGTGGAGGDGMGGMPGLDADNVKYEWSNFKVYVTAAAQGTQFSADLKYTENDCELQYHVVALWPAVSCAGDDGMGNPVPDDTLCNPCPNFDAGLTSGSGISPDFPTKCDPDLLLCVLADAKDKTKPAADIPQILSTSIDCSAASK